MISSDRLKQLANAAATAAINLSRPNYFESNSSRGENYELRNDLNSELQVVRREALRKVIASMTVGKDVSGLFPDVVKCMQTADLEMKKLVYLYLMNYAKSQPELVILAINTFCKDTEDQNPLLRALALRTMACIRVEEVLDYIIEPLRRCLQDESAYVRKTAAICVAKVYDISPELVDECGFLEQLQAMLTDSNPMVISNVVAALRDIQESRKKDATCVDDAAGDGGGGDGGIFEIDSRILTKLLGALNDATEWGQIAILDSLASASWSSLSSGLAEEREVCIEKVLPRLQHANPGVVLAAVKLLLILTAPLDPARDQLAQQVERKLAPPLVTLLASPPEIQWLVLRNLTIILSQPRHRAILERGVRVFFCKYNDPLWVKIEKVNLMVLLVDGVNGDQVLAELAEYAREIDVDFVQKSIEGMGRCVLQVPSLLARAVAILGELAGSEITHVLDQVIMTVQLLLRRFPDEKPLLRGLCGVLAGKVEVLDEHKARAAGLWLLGEFPGCMIPTAEETMGGLDGLVETLRAFAAPDNLPTETASTQSELLTTLTRLYGRAVCATATLGEDEVSGDGSPFCGDPSFRREIGEVLRELLEVLSKQYQNVDLRDRAILLGRLFFGNNDKDGGGEHGSDEQLIISFTRQINQLYLEAGMRDTVGFEAMEAGLLERLTRELANLSSVFHLPPEDFTSTANRHMKAGNMAIGENKIGGGDGQRQKTGIADLLDLGGNAAAPAASPTTTRQPTDSILDLL